MPNTPGQRSFRPTPYQWEWYPQWCSTAAPAGEAAGQAQQLQPGSQEWEEWEWPIAQLVRWRSRTRCSSKSPTDCRKGGPRQSPSGANQTTVATGRQESRPGELLVTGCAVRPGVSAHSLIPSNEQDYCHGDAWWACIQRRDLGVAVLGSLAALEGEVDPPRPSTCSVSMRKRSWTVVSTPRAGSVDPGHDQDHPGG